MTVATRPAEMSGAERVWHTLTVEAALAEQGVAQETGLTSADVAARRQK